MFEAEQVAKRLAVLRKAGAVIPEFDQRGRYTDSGERVRLVMRVRVLALRLLFFAAEFIGKPAQRLAQVVTKLGLGRYEISSDELACLDSAHVVIAAELEKVEERHAIRASAHGV